MRTVWRPTVPTWVPVMVREIPGWPGAYEYHVECPNLPMGAAPFVSWLDAFNAALQRSERFHEGLPWRLVAWDDNGWPLSDLGLATLF